MSKAVVTSIEEVQDNIFAGFYTDDNLEKFEKDLVGAIRSEYRLSEKQAGIIYHKAYEEGHSGGDHEIVSYANEYGAFARDILDNAG